VIVVRQIWSISSSDTTTRIHAVSELQKQWEHATQEWQQKERRTAPQEESFHQLKNFELCKELCKIYFICT
jgi:hypothetical protein